MRYKKTNRIIARVKREDIIYINSIAEAYDGIMVMRTVDPEEALVEFDISPYLSLESERILSALSKETPLEIVHADKSEPYE